MATPTQDQILDLEELLDELPLWRPQQDAVQAMRRYIAAYRNGETEKSALVHMPTGSGKTGVIAALARCLPEVDCALILTPRIALRQQLREDISSRFFEHLNPPVDPGRLPKQVVEISEYGQVSKVENFAACILILSIQMLNNMAKQQSKEWKTLLKHVSLVIVDEGHCEPAVSWSQAIRSFHAPRIIFTATPFRNDLKVFDIDIEHVFSYTFHDALQDHILRNVEFIRMKPSKDPNRFVDEVLGFYNQQFDGQEGTKPRVIIRCDHRQEIRQIETVLRKRGVSFIAIHERFTEGDRKEHEYKHVPDLNKVEAKKDEEPTKPREGQAEKEMKEDPIFWIHQYKLQEGIDDSRFQVLASFEPQRDGRALVQQIGRIIRNPRHDPNAKGYVLDFSKDHQQEDLWFRYLKYDEALTVSGPRAFKLASDSGWLASLFESQPILTYMKYRFRKPLVLENVEPRLDLIVPRMVNLRYEEEGFSLKRLCNMLEQGFREEDRVFHSYKEDGAVIYLYITFENSPLLENAYFLEPKLGMTYLREIIDYKEKEEPCKLLAYYDSSGYMPIDLDMARLGKAVSSTNLKKLFSNHPKSRLTHVSLRNSNLGTIALRAHWISAPNIKDTVAAFDDHAQICTNVTGYSFETQGKAGKSRFRRYLGFPRGRISDAGGRCHLREYDQWLANLVETLKDRRKSYSTFSRYAVSDVELSMDSPRHILLDLLEVEDTFETVDGGEALEIDDVSQEIKKGTFWINANGKRCKVGIEFDPGSRRYLLSSSDLDGMYSRTIDQTDNRDLITYLNQEQSFRVIPAKDNLIYTLGEFYQPLFKVGPAFKPKLFEVGKVLVPVPVLAEVGEEKGIPVAGDGWPDQSLFGIIDKLGRPTPTWPDPSLFEWVDDLGNKRKLHDYFGTPDILVCDDMGTEAADFIMADTAKNRVVFIHAKAHKPRSRVSASALQEVIGQATKNINFLGMFNDTAPDKLASWENPWKGTKGVPVLNRIRCYPTVKSKVWEQIHSIIRHPLADREVWLFTGQTLSKKRFEDLLGKTHPDAEALQAAYLLFATLTNVASVGAKLRVFCYP